MPPGGVGSPRNTGHWGAPGTAAPTLISVGPAGSRGSLSPPRNTGSPPDRFSPQRGGATRSSGPFSCSDFSAAHGRNSAAVTEVFGLPGNERIRPDARQYRSERGAHTHL